MKEPKTTLTEYDLKVEKSIPAQHHLIVIGNGFDLECGLKSHYSDFAVERAEIVGKLLAELMKNPTGAIEKVDGADHITVWDIILKGEQGSRWYDIESVIESWVKRPPDDSVDAIDKIELLRAALEASEWEYTIHEDVFGLVSSRADMKRLIWQIEKIVRYLWAKRGAGGFSSRGDALSFFFKELHRMETEFMRYLKEEVENNTIYHENAKCLMQTILQDQRAYPLGYEVHESVLSFNYTSSPFGWRNDLIYTNIHGYLFREIVFGIDGTDCMDDEDVVPFTKTYRIMDLGVNRDRDIIRTPSTVLLSREADLIKFYGHSLGRADHAYFQAMFDAVNLYGGDTRLIFYYRPHGDNGDVETRRRRAKEDAMRNATRLLVEYGMTMDNVDHGRNLVHKLLLEGRLSITELPRL